MTAGKRILVFRSAFRIFILSSRSLSGVSKGRAPHLTKHALVFVDFAICAPEECAPDTGVCASAKACGHKVIKQIDGHFEPPALFQDLCLTCGDCEKACPLGAIRKRDTH